MKLLASFHLIDDGQYIKDLHSWGEIPLSGAEASVIKANGGYTAEKALNLLLIVGLERVLRQVMDLLKFAKPCL